MRKTWLKISLVAAILGVIASSVSLYEYRNMQKQGLEEASFCAINETINCDIVNASSYATLAGVPIAALGILFHLSIICLVLFAIFRKEDNVSHSLAWIMSLFGVIWTARMAYASFVMLGALCLTCGLQYIFNISLFIALTVAGGLLFKKVLSRKILPYAIMVGIIFGIGYAVALSAVPANAISKKDLTTVVSSHFRQSKYDISPESLETAPMWGNPDAKVTMVEFSDFQCPFCRMAAFNIKPYLHEFRKDVNLRFVNYPLDSTCNKYMSGQMHPQSCLAAEAAYCASQKDKFWEYHEDVFKNQRKLSRELRSCR